jgi:hypothetical protein
MAIPQQMQRTKPGKLQEGLFTTGFASANRRHDCQAAALFPLRPAASLFGPANLLPAFAVLR